VGLHEKMLFALGPGGELFAGNEELGAGVGVNRNPELLGKSRKGVNHVVLVGIEKMDFSDLMSLNPVCKDGGVVGTERRIGKAVIEGAKLLFLQVGGVVTHGGVEKSEFLLVVAKVGSAGGRLDHSDEEVGGWGGKKGMGRKKLVPKNPDQPHQPKLEEIREGQA